MSGWNGFAGNHVPSLGLREFVRVSQTWSTDVGLKEDGEAKNRKRDGIFVRHFGFISRLEHHEVAALAWIEVELIEKSLIHHLHLICNSTAERRTILASCSGTNHFIMANKTMKAIVLHGAKDMRIVRLKYPQSQFRHSINPL